MADELNKPPYAKGLHFPKLKDVEGKEIENGELLYIPYSKILGNVIVRTHQADTIFSFNFTFETDKSKTISATIEGIKSLILQTPWSSVRKHPVIRLKTESFDNFSFNITVFSIDEANFNKIKDYIKEKYK